MRWRLSACLQHLRLESDRCGERDVLLAALDTAEDCRGVLELLVAGGDAQAAVEPTTLVGRALRTVEAESLQATRVLTWNICGEESAFTAPETFGARDKLAWLRAEIFLLQPDVLALQECVSEAPLGILAPLYRLQGTAPAHKGYVHLYVRQGQECEVVAALGPGIPAVVSKLVIGQHRLLVVAAHLPANRLGDLPEQQVGPAGRIKAMHDIATRLRPEQGPVVLMGDLNVRDEEVRDLLELGAWRDVGYGQSSWAPRLNDFYGPANRLGGKPGAGHRFDRIWLRGAV